MMTRFLPIATLLLMALGAACGGQEADTTLRPALTPTVAPVDESDLAVAKTRFDAGVSFQEAGRIPEAIAEYDEAIRLNSRDANAYNNRGNAYYGLGRHERAIEDYDEAISLDPQSADAYYNRGVARYDLGRYELAVKDYDEAIRLNPQDTDAYNNRGLAYAGLELLYPGPLLRMEFLTRFRPAGPHLIEGQ